MFPYILERKVDNLNVEIDFEWHYGKQIERKANSFIANEVQVMRRRNEIF